MLLIELLSVLYSETVVDICLDYVSVFKGLAEDALESPYINRRVKEVYIELDSESLVISISEERRRKTKKEYMNE